MILPRNAENHDLKKEHEGTPLPASDLEGAYNARQRKGKNLQSILRYVAFTCISLTIFGRFACLNPTQSKPLPEPGAPLEAFASIGYHEDRLSQQERETLFLSIPAGKSAHDASRLFSKHAHIAGSPQDFLDAKEMLKLFSKEFGITEPERIPIFSAGSPESQSATRGLTSSSREPTPDAWIDVYYPYLDSPVSQSLEVLSSYNEVAWSADLVEDGDPLDADAHKYRNEIQAWHGYSAHGEAIGNLVYANYGTQEDYAELVSQGVNLTGKIVLARYGGIYRGLKIKGAEELGASGILLYSDPRDDGVVTAENGYSPYPSGPARNPSSVQRGSAMYLSSYPGDPTTPGYPAYENATRIEPTNIPKIPSLPISWSNAQRLMEEIGEMYKPGGEGKRMLSGQSSRSTVRMSNQVSATHKPIWNTMASIPGHIRDEVILLGCHRDAWVLGAADPISGTAALHEIVRGFGTLLRHGWKPLRTIIIASWDGEEAGLLGSTEYGEDFADWLKEHVVSYLNVDVAVSGSAWNIKGSPSLAHLLKETAQIVPHPVTAGKTLWDARSDKGPFQNYSEDASFDSEYITLYDAKLASRDASDTGVEALGSGSDYTVFLQRLGIASTDQGFGPTPYDAAYHYHSIYDSLRWQEVYADPDFSRHVAVAKHLGLTALRLIDAIVLPLNTTQYAVELDSYVDRIEKASPITGIDYAPLRTSIKTLQESSRALDGEKEAAEKIFRDLLGKLSQPKLSIQIIKTVSNFIRTLCGDVIPAHECGTLPPWEPSQAWQARHALTTSEPVGLLRNLLQQPFPLEEFIRAAKRVAKVNKSLRSFEAGFISDEGIKDREWYRHLGVAPGKWLGYGATTLPGLDEAVIIDQNVTLAIHERDRLIKLFNNLASRISPLE